MQKNFKKSFAFFAALALSALKNIDGKLDDGLWSLARGLQPLYDLMTVVNLISHTTTNEGLTVCCAVDDTKYEKGIQSH